MFSEFTHQLIEAIRQNGPQSVFWAGIIEQIISPIPSVLIPSSAGFILIPQNLPFWESVTLIFKQISLPYALGATIGTTVLYWLTFFGGRAIVAKFGKFFGISLKHIDLFRTKFTRGFKDEVLIFLLVALPATPISLVAASCGLIGIPAWEFYPLVFAGTMVRSLVLGWIGWQAGEGYQMAVAGLDQAEGLLTILAAGLALLVVAFLYYKRQKILK